MGHSSVRIKVRRRKVANLAAYSRQHTVNNMPKKKPTFDKKKLTKVTFNDGKDVHFVLKCGEWEKIKYPQPKNLHKRIRGQKWIKHKDGTTELIKWDHPSEFHNPQDYQKKLWKNLSKEDKMKAYEDEKVRKWEKKHPKPCPEDDLFKDEFIPKWEKEHEEALTRIRDFVVSMFDKLPLTGRYKEGDNKFTEKPVAELKDVNGDGHRVNELDSKSKLLDKAQKVTNKEKANNAKLVATNLKDHKRKKGRVILPKAA